MASYRQFAGVDLESYFTSVGYGINKYMGDKETMVINGKPVGKDPLLAMIAAMKKPYDDVEAARQELARLITIRDAAEAKAAVFAEAVEAGITSNWGPDPQVKAKYGVPPPKNRRELTVLEKLQVVAKSQETRAQRGTLGKRQKAKIKATGEVSVTTTLHPPGTATGNADGTQPSGSGVVGSAPLSGGTNVVAGAPAMGGAPAGGINVVTGTPPATGGTNVLAGAPAAGSGAGNVVAGGPPKAVDNSGLGGAAASEVQNGAGH